jgi:hypothetical protein
MLSVTSPFEWGGKLSSPVIGGGVVDRGVGEAVGPVDVGNQRGNPEPRRSPPVTATS